MRKHYGGLAQVAICGAGFLADAYDLFVINIVKDVMKPLYPQSTSDTSLVATTALAGAIAGQVIFGGAADYLGRRAIFICTCLLVIIGSIGSSLVWPVGTFNIYSFLAIFRFILGFGIGGEYPLSATITSENSSDVTRGRNIAAVFSMQGWGMLLSALVLLISTQAGASAEFDWRFALAFGALPGIIAFYFRWTMRETATFEKHTEISADEPHLNRSWRIIKSHWKPLAGTAGSWFIFDVVFYANGLFSASIITALGLTHNLNDTIVYSVYVALMAIPGYYFSIFFIDILGRKPIQIMGFTMMGILYCIIGIFREELQDLPALFLILYGLTYFFSNFGPNATTFVIPSEVFPTKVRATLHGFSAASGKLGAVVGGAALQPVLKAYGISVVLISCGVISFIGVLWTIVFIPYYSGGESLVEDDKYCSSLTNFSEITVDCKEEKNV